MPLLPPPTSLHHAGWQMKCPTMPNFKKHTQTWQAHVLLPLARCVEATDGISLRRPTPQGSSKCHLGSVEGAVGLRNSGVTQGMNLCYLCFFLSIIFLSNIEFLVWTRHLSQLIVTELILMRMEHLACLVTFTGQNIYELGEEIYITTNKLCDQLL